MKELREIHLLESPKVNEFIIDMLIKRNAGNGFI